MNLYIVTKLAKEESTVGVIDRVDVITYGVYTTETRANDIADKYDATVTEVVADDESRTIVDRWLNPGYST